jgi:hypothetical protein
MLSFSENSEQVVSLEQKYHIMNPVAKISCIQFNYFT